MIKIIKSGFSGTTPARRRLQAWTGALVLALITIMLSACQPAAEPEPGVLRVSAIPDQSPERVHQQHGPLVDLVCAAAAVRCEWTPGRSYEDVVARLGSGEIDLAYLGGATFAQAYQQHGAVPVAMRDIDLLFTSVVVVREDSAIHRLEQLRGRSFAFGNRSSTSGHVMPRELLRREGIEPDRDFASIVFSGSHDATLRMVARGEIEAAVVNSAVGYRAIAAGNAEFKGLKVIWQSPPFSNYVWAVRKGLPRGLRQRLLDAFLDLDKSTPERKAALEHAHAGGFLPAYAADFNSLIELMKREDRR
ncbi:MAG: phosphate/phosphite/phosphonate ABC transporter substrate-binding protein [Alphaproteobacteria bacterium]|nr:phosphate/phosphite/phosphonate ABC transporter substrate-binding protein [Alphaproteobacteria bacterium]